MNPQLPQNDSDQQKRLDYLNKQKDAYEYDYDYLSPLVMLKDVPTSENFSVEYTVERAAVTAKLIPNMLGAKAKSFLDPLDDLQDFEDLFSVLPLPAVAKVYQSNASFAEQRLSGVNPVMIRALKSTDPRAELLKILPSYKPEFEPLFNIPQELENGNLYITDYTGEDENYQGASLVQGGSHQKGRKYLPKPLAFFWDRSHGTRSEKKLVPIAIYLDQRMYHPFVKPMEWLLAKLSVQIADINHHEMNTHLCRAHFVMEPIAIGTARHLAENHPLGILLRPHFKFLMANNRLGQLQLINPGGPVDTLLGGTLAESMELVKDAYVHWSLDQFALPTEIKNRGLDDPTKLTHYPYRDDAMLIWKPLKTFVAGYLNYFYPNPAAIAEDYELQAWAQELTDQVAGGKVKGMPSQIETVEELIEIVTTIIFISGPFHSAINFPQYDYIAFAPNMPLAAYSEMPASDSVITEKQILQFLPTYERAASQLQIVFGLSDYRYDRFGYYDRKFNATFNGTEVELLIRQFQQDLFVVEQQIDDRNRTRVVPYPYLKPSLVLNSTSI